jgi:hypothetical protein
MAASQCLKNTRDVDDSNTSFNIYKYFFQSLSVRKMAASQCLKNTRDVDDPNISFNIYKYFFQSLSVRERTVKGL